MKYKSFLIGAACGIAASLLTQNYLEKNKSFSSDEVLKKVKDSLQSDGKIVGSWIMAKPEIVERNSVPYKVYQGGVTKLKNDEQLSMEFVADAKTGTILDIENV